MTNEDMTTPVPDEQTSGSPVATADTIYEMDDTDVTARKFWTDSTYNASAYILNGLSADITDLSKSANLMSGFSDMDKVQPLLPGLYVMGAVPSLGKTTFTYQMADQIASQGVPVLVFTLEMSHTDLVLKSLSRYTYMQNKLDSSYKAFTATQIKSGEANGSHELANAKSAYTHDVQSNLWICSCITGITIEEIDGVISEASKHFGRSPVVIIDYAQIVKPSSHKYAGDAKVHVDHVMQSLKTMQTRYMTTVIAICSLSRAYYFKPVDLDAYKESGGIEYSADVVWGLQLSLFEKTSFINLKKPEERSMALKKAKGADIRELDLVVLKNRFGAPSTTFHFKYYSAYDLFVPDGNPIPLPPSFGGNNGVVISA